MCQREKENNCKCVFYWSIVRIRINTLKRQTLSDVVSPLNGYANYRFAFAPYDDNAKRPHNTTQHTHTHTHTHRRTLDAINKGQPTSTLPFSGVYLSNLTAIEENPGVFVLFRSMSELSDE
jgi:hypothetical protein